jgi:hypothetical protein
MIVIQPGEARVLSTFDYIEEVIDPPYATELAYGEAAAN